MKKLITFAFALLVFQLVNAQSGDREFKKFKVDVSLGYAIPQGSSEAGGKKGGVLFVIEPKYAVMDELSVGLRMEGALMANVNVAGETGSVKANGSYLATGDYYFTNNKFRPFGGIGAGLFTHASVDLASDNMSTPPIGSNFGFMARGGFEYGHLRMGLEYNIVGKKSNYIGIKIGACIGGGRK